MLAKIRLLKIISMDKHSSFSVWSKNCSMISSIILNRGRLSTVELLIKVACFSTKVNNIFNLK
jgi:hypothetical protein